MATTMQEDSKKITMNGVPKSRNGITIITSIPSAPVTMQRKVFVPGRDCELVEAGVARANLAADRTHPEGTTKGDWNQEHKDETVLQQHCNFFDKDQDGVIWPGDTYDGFRRLGFNVLLSFFAMHIIHVSLSYPTTPNLILPDPFFRIYVDRIHRDKHGSDSGSYDNEGRFRPQAFEDMFAKYSTQPDKNGMNFRDIVRAIISRRCVMDFFGWSASTLEWLATYIMLWPEDGVMRKEDIRGTYDGSIFYTIAATRGGKKMR